MNPLIDLNPNTPLQTIPFNLIQNDHYLSAFDKGIELAEKDIDSIIQNTQEPNFKNTIEALENSGELLDYVSSIFFNLNSAETNDEMQKIAQQVSPKLTQHSNNILLNQKLFNKVKQVYDSKPNLGIEEQKLLEKTYKSFVRNGALLSEDKKEELRNINISLSTKTLSFGENTLAENNNFEYLVEDEKDLMGIPENVLIQTKELAESKNLKGYLLTLDYPIYIPIITYAQNRELRKKMYLAFNSKANQNNLNDNKKLIIEIVQLRDKKAKLLGYANYAEYVLEERMAKSPKNVFDFLSELKDKSIAFAQKEKKELEGYARKLDGLQGLERWDTAYYAEKLKIETINLDEQLLKPYFKLENVIEGVFTLAKDLFQLQFKQRTDIPVYHPDVLTYEILDKNNSLLAVFYADFFPRKGKRQGAWMTNFKTQNATNRPHVANVCNFTKPTKNEPSLLTFNEVTTLFHEFGHALHSILSQVKYKSLAGTNVLWDFVELPSQLLENWCYEKLSLQKFAKHYETNEVIPDDLVERIKKSMQFRSASANLRQVGLATLDLKWHTTVINDDTNVVEFERNALLETDLYPIVNNCIISTQFGHIFQGGYAAGYYSYKWAEILEADVYESFEEAGVLNTSLAEKLVNEILSKGGTQNPETLFINFKGRAPKPDALLKKMGLI
jgi:Zn-dependent oligopeptidase